jgi:hypothetical protein
MSIKTFQKLSPKERDELTKGVINVYGKAMNRTALGIVDALIQLYPNCTFSELKEMLPDTINPSAPKNYKSLFKPYTNINYGVIQPGTIRQQCEKDGLDVNASHFVAEGETFKTSDNIEVLVSKSWESEDTETGEKDLQNLIDHVSQYGVRVVEYTDKKPFGKGGYQLEIINPRLKERLAKKTSLNWLWILLGVLVVGLITALILAK